MVTRSTKGKKKDTFTIRSKVRYVQYCVNTGYIKTHIKII